jgi:hypothetical protein
LHICHVDRHGHFTLRQLRLLILNESHTNSYTGPRLILLILNGEWDIIRLFLNILSIIKNAMVICKTVYILQTIYILFYVQSKRCILHVPSLEKLVQPFKCYQITLLSLTYQMIVLVKAQECYCSVG